jgi:heat shock protein HslJ
VHRRSWLLLPAMALLVLAAPALALADQPAGQWQITGIVLGGSTKIAANGTLSLSGSNLGVTIGCNSIGGQATLDGDTLTIVGDLTTTLIGCPADVGEAETALMKILSGGPLTIAADRWTDATGDIDVVDASGANGGGGVPMCIPPVAPGANPGNVTVPCGNGGSGSGGSDIGVLNTVGTPVEGPPPPDPLTVVSAIGVIVLLVATIVVFIYLGPRRASGGRAED